MRLDPDVRRALDQLPPGSWSLRPAKRALIVMVNGSFAGYLGRDGSAVVNNRSRDNLLAAIRRLGRRA